MPGYIHGLIQIEFSILVENGIRAGRERGMSEGGGMTHSPWPAPHSDPSLMGTGPAVARPTPNPKLNKPVTGSMGDTQVLVSSLATSLSDLREFIFSVPVLIHKTSWLGQ